MVDSSLSDVIRKPASCGYGSDRFTARSEIYPLGLRPSSLVYRSTCPPPKHTLLTWVLVLVLSWCRWCLDEDLIEEQTFFDGTSSTKWSSYQDILHHMITSIVDHALEVDLDRTNFPFFSSRTWKVWNFRVFAKTEKGHNFRVLEPKKRPSVRVPASKRPPRFEFCQSILRVGKIDFFHVFWCFGTTIPKIWKTETIDWPTLVTSINWNPHERVLYDRFRSHEGSEHDKQQNRNDIDRDTRPNHSCSWPRNIWSAQIWSFLGTPPNVNAQLSGLHRKTPEITKHMTTPSGRS